MVIGTEAQLRGVLRTYGIELRRVAYGLPNGVGEHELLRLSEQMITAADEPRVGVQDAQHA
jgi:hypothetical protein